MRKMIMLVSVSVLILISGCIETSTSVKVKKDGSGVILLKAYFDQDAVKKMAGGAANMMGDMMGGAMGEMADSMSDGSATAENNKIVIKQKVKKGINESEMKMTGPKSFYNEASARSLAKAFGKSVKFVKGKELSHADGRKGFEAIYAFNDISKVVVGQDIGDMIIESMEQQGGSGEREPMMDAYRFTFKKGKSAKLSIKPLPTKKDLEKIWMADASPEEIADYKASMGEEENSPGDEDSGKSEMEAQMEAQMLAAFKGKKDTIAVIVDGTVTSSNASYKSKKYPNKFYLLQMDYNKILSHPEGKKLFKAAPETRHDFIKAAKKAKVPGCLAEDPSKTVVITFK